MVDRGIESPRAANRGEDARGWFIDVIAALRRYSLVGGAEAVLTRAICSSGPSAADRGWIADCSAIVSTVALRSTVMKTTFISSASSPRSSAIPKCRRGQADIRTVGEAEERHRRATDQGFRPDHVALMIRRRKSISVRATAAARQVRSTGSIDLPPTDESIRATAPTPAAPYPGPPVAASVLWPPRGDSGSAHLDRHFASRRRAGSAEGVAGHRFLYRISIACKFGSSATLSPGAIAISPPGSWTHLRHWSSSRGSGIIDGGAKDRSASPARRQCCGSSCKRLGRFVDGGTGPRSRQTASSVPARGPPSPQGQSAASVPVKIYFSSF